MLLFLWPSFYSSKKISLKNVKNEELENTWRLMMKKWGAVVKRKCYMWKKAIMNL